MAQKITACLWFKGNAKEAVDFYCSVFADAHVIAITYYPQDGLADFQKNRAGEVLTIDFELLGQRFTALNAGEDYPFTQAVSFVVSCKDQDEIDYYWDKLSADPKSEQCGWLKDKYGLSWQIVPENLEELMGRPDAFAHLMHMKKLVIADF